MGSFLLSAVQVTKTANDLFGLFSTLAGFAFDETDRVIEGRRLEQFQFLTSGEGRPIPRVWGRMRIGGHVIFADAVRENMASHDVGGKGSGGGATRREYRYTMSFAVGLCQGEVRQVGRIWADGEELDLSQVSYRLYSGSETQTPDPLLEECLGQDHAPGFRGLAYVVFEDFDLSQFGNRLPQLSFEVFAAGDDLADAVSAVNVIPGATEFGYDPIPHVRLLGRARAASENIHISPHKSDWAVAMDQLQQSCPNASWVSLVVTWFADDLRLQNLSIAPRTETINKDTYPTSWSVQGRKRQSVPAVSALNGRPAYGGTPSDASVQRAVQDLHARGYKVMFYPFIMLDVPQSTNRPDPYSDSQQARFPWRGEITCYPAPGRAGSPDGTAAIDKMIDDLFVAADGSGLTSMVKHYAKLCADAGGVEAFVLASELRGISRLRNARNEFPFAKKLGALAADVRNLLPDTKISYAADWTEYGILGGNPALEDFPLDAFWADKNCDFVGIDCYFPLSDWRDGELHIDARDGAPSIYDLGYLSGQVRGGEQFDYYYVDQKSRDQQIRSPLKSDGVNAGLHRMKDIHGWWSSYHNRLVNGMIIGQTSWQPQSKPIWFTELGCPAVDKGSNQPNLFPDLQRGQAGRPYYSSGLRDDLIQRSYMRAILNFYRNPENNPVSVTYGSHMIPRDAFFVWSWDARPYPAFPYARDVWSDADNWETGHWINARLSSASLTDMLSDLTAYDLQFDGTKFNTGMDGYIVDRVQSRQDILQPLLRAFSLDVYSKNNILRVSQRLAHRIIEIAPEDLVTIQDGPAKRYTISDRQRLPHEVRLSYYRNDAAYEPAIATARKPGAMAPVQSLSLPAVLSSTQAQHIAERILREAWEERDHLTLTLSPAYNWLEPTDVILFEGRHWRIVAVEHSEVVRIETIAHNQNLYSSMVFGKIASSQEDGYQPPKIYHPYVVMLDLPADWPARPINAVWPAGVPVVAATGSPFPSRVRVTDEAETWSVDVEYPAITGRLVEALPAGPSGRWLSTQSVRVELDFGALQSRKRVDVLNGENVLAIATDKGWEVLQFSTAELVGADTYELSDLLRGQVGSDSVMENACPAGRDCVLISNALKPLPLELGSLGEELLFRYGPLHMEETSFAWQAAEGNVRRAGLTCLAPVHLRAGLSDKNNIEISWVRRGRIDADDFEAANIILGEVEELYRLRIWADNDLVYEELLSSPSWSYTASEWQSDYLANVNAKTWSVDVAQISQKTGAGFRALLNISALLRPALSGVGIS